MQHKFAILPERRLVVLHYIGLTHKDDIKEMALQIWNHPDYDQTFDGIMDCRNAILQLSPQDINELAEYFVVHPDALTGKVAVVALGPMETVLTMIYAKRLAPKNSMKIFFTWVAACAFVGVDGLPDPFSEISEELERRFRYLTRMR